MQTFLIFFTMQFIITNINFDCTLDDADWTQEDVERTQQKLQEEYIGEVWEADDEEDLVDEISTASGWCINSIEYRHLLV